jgi:hypothetical protein
MPHELNPDWPHGVFAEAPGALHISPRTAYYMHEGKLVFERLEELTEDDCEAVCEDFNNGVKPHER